MIKEKNTVIIDNDKYRFLTGKFFLFIKIYRKIKFIFELILIFFTKKQRYVYLFYNPFVKVDLYRMITRRMFQNPNKNISIDNKIIYEKKESEFLSRIMAEYHNFFDIGAHQGYYSYIATNYCKKVFSFEPLKEFYNEINHHIKLNNIQNIKLFNLGFGNNNKIKYGNYLQIQTFKTNKLDDFFKNQNILNSSLLKIDVDGFEKDLIDGAKKIIFDKKIDVFIDIYFDRVHSGYDLLNFLKKNFSYSYYLSNVGKSFKILNISQNDFTIDNLKKNQIYTFYFTNKSFI